MSEGERGAMVWLWTRGSNELRIEMRYDKDAAEFLVTIVFSDRSHSSERFQTLSALTERVSQLERRLESEHWAPVGRPLFLPVRLMTPELSSAAPSAPPTADMRDADARQPSDVTLKGLRFGRANGG